MMIYFFFQLKMLLDDKVRFSAVFSVNLLTSPESIRFCLVSEMASNRKGQKYNLSIEFKKILKQCYESLSCAQPTLIVSEIIHTVGWFFACVKFRLCVTRGLANFACKFALFFRCNCTWYRQFAMWNLYVVCVCSAIQIVDFFSLCLH